MTQQTAKGVQPPKSAPLRTLIILILLSLFFADAPGIRTLLQPITTFVTALHELSHAIACLATGGSVHGMTIVPDNAGHGGLTLCSGGMPFVYTQAGYLGTAVFGCLFIYLGRFPVMSKAVLMLMGGLVGLFSIWFMPGGIFSGKILESLGSIVWGLLLGGTLIYAGMRLKPATANLILLFLAVQTALNSLTDVGYLIKVSTGLIPNPSFTDASTMQNMTMIPAVFWSLLWALLSCAMLAATLWFGYGLKLPWRKGPAKPLTA